MQRVKSGYDLIHPLMREIETLYAETSIREQGQSLVVPTHNQLVAPIVDLFQWGGCSYKFNYVNEPIKRLKVPKFDPKNIIVCFSGGKDSFAVARHYQKMGYNVYLYHLRGLNATYCGRSSESNVAIDCAGYMGLPIIVEDIGYSGYHEWTEHPMKNMLLLNRAISYGVRNGLTCKVAVGTFRTVDVWDVSFDVCGGDSSDMLRAYEKVIKSFLPGFKLYIPSANYQTAYNLLLKEPEALKHLSSCMTPNRFKDHFRKRTEKNYDMQFLPNRCGCCWKDCVEYIWMVDHNLMELNERYYLHCLEVLRVTTYKEGGKFYHYIIDVWNFYLFYPMNKSKMYEVIKNATFTAKGKIKCTDKGIKG